MHKTHSRTYSAHLVQESKPTLGFYGERVLHVRMRRKTKKKLKKELDEKKQKDEED